MYLPLNVQRRFSEGILIPLAVLAVMGMKLSVRPLRNGVRSYRRRFVQTRRIVLALLLPSAVFFWLITFLGGLSPSCVEDSCAYRPQAELDALDWLAEIADKNTVVMGTERTGNYLPIRTDLRPFLGHGPETLYSADRREQVKLFFRGELSSNERERLLTEAGVQYVMFGQLERDLNDDPSVWNSGMSVIYDQNGYLIYEVERP